METKPRKNYTTDDLAFWANQEPARRFEVKWVGRPMSTPLTHRGGFRVIVWSNRSRSKANGGEPYRYTATNWELNLAIRNALQLFGETI